MPLPPRRRASSDSDPGAAAPVRLRRRELPPLLAAAFAPLLAARCAAPAQTEPCRFQAANPLPVAVANALPFLDVTVNGRPVVALLDTGAEATLVADALLAVVPMAADPLRHSFQAGATGVTAPRRQVYLPRLRMGTAEILSQLVSVIDRPLIPGPGGRAPDLIIGADVLSRFDLDVDLPGRRLTLFAPQPCRLDGPPFAGLSYALPLVVTPRRHLAVGVEANGRAAAAILDTGANVVQVSRARARAIGVTEADLAAGQKRQVRGVNNQISEVTLIRLGSLRIGPELHRSVPCLVGDDGPADFVIGTPWLINRRLFVSYLNRQLVVGLPVAMVPANPSPTPATSPAASG